MYAIDSPSAMILGGLGALLAAALLAGTRSSKPWVERGCRLLALGNLLIGLGMCSFLFSPALPPDMPVFLLGHGVALGSIAWGFGFRAMTDRGPMTLALRMPMIVLVALLPLAALASRAAFEICYPAALAALMVLFYIDMFRLIGSYQSRIAVGLHTVLFSLIASWALRALGAWRHQGQVEPTGLYLPWGGEQWLLASYSVLPLVVAVQVLLLLNVMLTRDLRRQAYVDSLTGVASRRGMTEAWPAFERRAREAGRTVAVVLFDLDRFKLVNDTYGHLVGDDALRHVVEVARAALRPGDHFARYGGEEFVLLLSVADISDAVRVGERVRKLIECSPCQCGKLELSLTISVGVTLAEPDENLSATIARADRHLYQAKNAGRNRLVASEETAI